MRPIYQELILPNLAYIGGGGEIAYWLERLDQFASFDIPFPVLVRRNSAMIVNANIQKNLNGISCPQSTLAMTKLIDSIAFAHFQMNASKAGIQSRFQ